jgi:ribosomal protein S12 methylthiotransferase
MRSFSIITLGCDKNTVDAEIMAGLLIKNGFEKAATPQEAEYIFINTCSFIAASENESFSAIEYYSQYKRKHVCKRLFVTGCLVELYEADIFNSCPDVDGVLGTASVDKIIDLVGIESDKPAIIDDNSRQIDENVFLERIISTPKHIAYLKIAEGCDNMCSYCTIPYIRGRYRTRSMESLINEATKLADGGVRELILVAQDTARFNNLALLLRRLSDIDGLEQIRLLYCYPQHITDELIDEMAVNPKVVKYIDMPIQHCSEAVLRNMNRTGNRNDLTKLINKLRDKIPNIAIRTTVIVGFPNETETHFNELLEFVKEMRFDRLGAFKYSREQGTPAYDMDNQVSEEVKQKRYDTIMQAQQEISSQKLKERVGQTMLVRLDEEGKRDGKEKGITVGRTYMDCYEIDGVVKLFGDTKEYVGLLCNVIITSSDDYDLYGSITH